MPDRADELKSFYRLLRQRQISGEAGRAQIVNRLAKMTAAELLRVPPWVIVRLGPKGLALLAERSAVIRAKEGGSAQIAEAAAHAVGAPTARPRLSWLADMKRRCPLWWECLCKMVVTTTVGLALITALPFAVRCLRSLEGPTSGREACTRLDRWTGHCIYRVGSSGLSLSQAADRLALPVAALFAANPDLVPDRSLPQGTLIAVPQRISINLR
ncbi:hypothetical protein ACQR1I_31840 [Bradyrhizobium sp. HKCCYLS2038]|uniref:hypothetical protein n=1 Tax=unclassified Bradyrhizobium TaxID=2631580 RepID=UPI003EBFCF3E